MLGICCHSLESVDHELAQGADIFILGGEHADRRRFFEQLRRTGDGERRRVVILSLAGTKAIPQDDHFADLTFNGIRVKVCVRDGHKKTVQHLTVERIQLGNVQLVRHHDVGDTLQRIEQ